MGIKLKRLQPTPYEYKYIPNNGGEIKNYIWRGSKVGYECVVEVPNDVFDNMKNYSMTLRNKKLVLVEDLKNVENTENEMNNEIKNEIESTMTEEELKKEVYSSTQIKELLEGNHKKLESIIKKVDKDMVNAFIRVAKEINLDSAAKRKILAEASNIPADALFE